MGRPKLFKEDYRSNKPKGFEFLIRPTKKEFYSFAHLLDKMVSENINKEFFMDDIRRNHEEQKKDGKIIINPKGTITLLKEWINRIEFSDPKPKDEMIEIFGSVAILQKSAQ